MRLLITGAAGCLGSNLAERYLARGVPVLGLDNFATGRRSALEPHPLLEMVEGDVGDKATVDVLFERFRPTRVIHAAASYNDPSAWALDIATNVTGTAHVAMASEAAGVEQIIYLQTALCYGRPRERPVTIEHGLAPFTSYAISKTAGEQYLAMCRVPFVSLRIANVYGPRAYTGPIPIFYKRLKAGQSCFVVETRRDFLEMSDFLELIDRVLAKPEVTGPLNVSTGTDVAIATLFEEMVALMGISLASPVRTVPPGVDDVDTLLLDPSRTRELLGWSARTALRDGLAAQIAWFDRHGVAETFTHLTSARG